MTEPARLSVSPARPRIDESAPLAGLTRQQRLEYLRRRMAAVPARGKRRTVVRARAANGFSGSRAAGRAPAARWSHARIGGRSLRRDLAVAGTAGLGDLGRWACGGDRLPAPGSARGRRDGCRVAPVGVRAEPRSGPGGGRGGAARRHGPGGARVGWCLGAAVAGAGRGGPGAQQAVHVDRDRRGVGWGRGPVGGAGARVRRGRVRTRGGARQIAFGRLAVRAQGRSFQSRTACLDVRSTRGRVEWVPEAVAFAPETVAR